MEPYTVQASRLETFLIISIENSYVKLELFYTNDRHRRFMDGLRSDLVGLITEAIEWIKNPTDGGVSLSQNLESVIDVDPYILQDGDGFIIETSSVTILNISADEMLRILEDVRREVVTYVNETS